MSPLISVVMPTFNRASLIIPAINSLLNQTYPHFELIIVDNKSSDNTQELIQGLHDERIKYIRINENKGEYWSTNYAISRSNGTFITWLHSDDLLPHDSLENRMNTFIKYPEVSFVHGDIEKIDDKSNFLQRVYATDQCSKDIVTDYIKALQKGEMVYHIHHTTILMKREFFDKTGPMDISLPFAGDIDWLVRALYMGTYKKTPEVLYYYRIHNKSRSVVDIQNGVDKMQIRKLIGNRYKNYLT
jgi:glycosyltransferase involved in cell wall biosynthesis